MSDASRPFPARAMPSIGASRVRETVASKAQRKTPPSQVGGNVRSYGATDGSRLLHQREQEVGLAFR
jgi:hypothetical protein